MSSKTAQYFYIFIFWMLIYPILLMINIVLLTLLFLLSYLDSVGYTTEI